MEKFEELINDHHDFLKSQAESYALCTAFFTAGALCIKHYEKLLYVPGILSCLCLWIIAWLLFSYNIKAAEKYVAEKISSKKTLKFLLVGAIYIISVICIGYSILFEAIAK